MSLARNLADLLNSSGLITNAKLATPGTVLQVGNRSLSTGASLSTVGNYDWQYWSDSEVTFTSVDTNSKWYCNFTGLAAHKSANPISFTLVYKVGAGSWTNMTAGNLSGGAETGDLGMTGSSNVGSTDDWNSFSLTAIATVTAAAGSTIYFRLAMRNGGPSTDVASTTNVVGHGLYNMQMSAMEIKS